MPALGAPAFADPARAFGIIWVVASQSIAVLTALIEPVRAQERADPSNA